MSLISRIINLQGGHGTMAPPKYATGCTICKGEEQKKVFVLFSETVYIECMTGRIWRANPSSKVERVI